MVSLTQAQRYGDTLAPVLPVLCFKTEQSPSPCNGSLLRTAFGSKSLCLKWRAVRCHIEMAMSPVIEGLLLNVIQTFIIIKLYYYGIGDIDVYIYIYIYIHIYLFIYVCVCVCV